MDSKIRLKYGALEIEYEGNENFIKEQLPDLLQSISDLFGNQLINPTATFPETIIEHETVEINDLKIDGTTNTIAAKLNVTTGPELVLAAAAQLTFVEGKEKFHRKDILENMQSATSYYKETYGSNLSGSLTRLVKSKKLSEQTKDVYALTATHRSNMEKKLAK